MPAELVVFVVKSRRFLLCCPATIDRHMRASHLGCGVRAQEQGGLADLFGGDELFGRVFVRDQIGCGLFDGNAAFLGLGFDLAFDQFGADPARAD